MMRSSRTYDELIQMDDFVDRFRYLELGGRFGTQTFGNYRYLNQAFYMSEEWRQARDEVIVRDEGCDLGVPGREINGTIYVHHINPITVDHLRKGDPCVTDPRNLICVSYTTHKALHYGDESMLALAEPVTRTSNDTCPWKGGML